MAIRSIFKALAGIQDVLWGRGSVTQSRNGTDYTIARVAKVHPVGLLVDLKALPTTDANNQYFEVSLKGTVAINDGNGGDLYFDATSLAAPDDLSIILPDDVPLVNPGRWIKLTDTGLLRTGDAATGAIKGVTPVAAADFTRKDYVDATFNKFLAGLSIDGTTFAFTGDLNTIAVNSVYIADANTVTNEPPGFLGLGTMLVDTATGVTSGRRVQIVTAMTSILATQRYIRDTNVGDVGWSSWRKLADMYDDDRNEVLVQAATIINAVNYFRAANSATGDDIAMSAQGLDIDIGMDLQTKGAGQFKVNGAPVETLMGEVVASSDQDSIEVTGLDPAYNGAYVIELALHAPSSGIQNVDIMINSDTVATNYFSRRAANTGSGETYAATNSPRVGFANTSSVSDTIITGEFLNTETGVMGEVIVGSFTTNVQRYSAMFRYSGVSITALGVNAPTGGVGAGSRIRVYKRNVF